VPSIKEANGKLTLRKPCHIHRQALPAKNADVTMMKAKECCEERSDDLMNNDPHKYCQRPGNLTNIYHQSGISLLESWQGSKFQKKRRQFFY
jgi:hypothetical protein